jgi:hypothetical protein
MRVYIDLCQQVFDAQRKSSTLLLQCRALFFMFVGTQLFDAETSNNEDHKVWTPL